MVQQEANVRPATLSLFSGAGGLDIGFHKVGFRIVACVEMESAFCETLTRNLGRYSDTDCHVLNRDITRLQPSEIVTQHIDFIIGGPPCQSFSAIGRRAGGIDGTNNARGSLFEQYCRLVEHYRPKGFLFENVRGILGSNRGQDWLRIVAAFAALGYRLSYRVLDCADYGVPQHRERLIMVGTRDGSFRFPKPTHGPDSPDQTPHVGARHAMMDLQDPAESVHTYSGKYGHLLKEVPPGLNYHYFTKEMGYPQPIFAWRSRFSDFLYKADPDKPVRTIVAQLGKYSGPFHWKNRKFTLAEFMRLQSFPDDYQFAGGLNTALKQIGNSVPPKLAERLAYAVRQQVFGVDMAIPLIADHERLSFDARKSRKARSTREKRIILNGPDRAYPLFAMLEPTAPKELAEYTTEGLLHYHSPRQRNHIEPGVTPATGTVYRIRTTRVAENCTIEVSSTGDSETPPGPRFRYSLRFHRPIGDGLEHLEATFFGTSDAGLPVVWDAIEDHLGACSGYESMIDVYGHFTEPHPIFDLRMEVLTEKPSFILRFAKRFSEFRATTRVLPARELQTLHADTGTATFDLADVVRSLRELRLDVRVNETNSTIPVGYFRCCYPFTININRQVSVRWNERARAESYG